MDKILSIPLASHDLNDRWKWYPEESGEYTVCSRYRLLLRGFPRTEETNTTTLGRIQELFTENYGRLMCLKIWKLHASDLLTITSPQNLIYFNARVGWIENAPAVRYWSRNKSSCVQRLSWSNRNLTTIGGFNWTLSDDLVDVPIAWIGQLFGKDEKQTQLFIITIWAIWNHSWGNLSI